MSRRRNQGWFSLGMNAWMLGVDAAAVVGLRVAKMATGDAAATTEAQRMVSEKIQAAMELQMLALQGALGTSPASALARSMRHYGPKVRANRRRLGKS